MAKYLTDIFNLDKPLPTPPLPTPYACNCWCTPLEKTTTYSKHCNRRADIKKVIIALVGKKKKGEEDAEMDTDDEDQQILDTLTCWYALHGDERESAQNAKQGSSALGKTLNT